MQKPNLLFEPIRQHNIIPLDVGNNYSLSLILYVLNKMHNAYNRGESGNSPAKNRN